MSVTIAVMSFLLAGTARAQRVEALREAGNRGFEQSAATAKDLKPVTGKAASDADDERADPAVAAQVVGTLRSLFAFPAGTSAPVTARGATIYLRLAPVKNGFWRNPNEVSLGGRPGWLSLMVARSQATFGAALGETDAVPQLINAVRLIQAKTRVTVNGAAYDVWLAPDIFDKLASKVKLRGVAKGDLHSITLRALLAGQMSTGFPAPISGRTYKVFYFDDVQDVDGRGRLDAEHQNVAFALEGQGEPRFSVIPLESIPSKDMAVFALTDGTKVGLQLQEDGAVLAIVPNP